MTKKGKGEIEKIENEKAEALAEATEADEETAEEEDDEEKLVRVNLLDILLDEDNTAPIYMFNDDGDQMKFEQIAVIPYGKEDLYCILKPSDKINGIADDEAIVFKVIEDEDGESILRVEDDERKAIEIFLNYYRLVLDESEEIPDALEEKIAFLEKRVEELNAKKNKKDDD